jgi:hypothetical protein
MPVPTNALTYNGYVTQVATMAVVNTQTVSGVVQSTDAAFNAIIPQMLNYAELRIQRDIDFLQSGALQTTALSAGTKYITYSSADFKTIDTVNIVTTSTSSYEVLSTLIPTTKEFAQNVYPSTAVSANWGTPKYFYLFGDLGSQDNINLFIVPQPSASCYIQTIGTSWLDSLYKYATAGDAGTATTYISSYLPDLLVLASMIYISAYQRNFGRQSDDPAMAQSYEAQYKTLLPAANNAEEQKRFQASAWSSSSVPTSATPTR